MKRMVCLSLMALAVAGTQAFADVKYQETTQVKFSGGLGTVMRLAGGSKPQTSTLYLKDNALRTDRDKTSQIIDLNKEAFIDINHDKKQYTVLTFAELRQRVEKAAQEAEKEMKAQPQGGATPESVQFTFDVKVDPTGKTQALEGRTAELFVLTMSVEGQDTTAAKGGLVTTSEMWMTKNLEGYEEVAAFHRRMAEKLGQEWAGGAARMREMLAKTNPELAAAMERLAAEARKLEGTPLVTTTTFDVVGTPPPQGAAATPAPEAEPSEPPKLEKPSVGGLMGRFGKKKLEERQKAKEAEKAQSGGRTNMMTSTTTLSGFSRSALSADLFQVPAGYAEVKLEE